MNLITRLRNFFYETQTPQLPNTEKNAAADHTLLYQQLLSALQQACANVPGGKAFVICGNGEFGIRLTWTPEATAPATPKQVYCIEGNGKATGWEEQQETEMAEEQPISPTQPPTVQESSPKKEASDTWRNTTVSAITAWQTARNVPQRTQAKQLICL